MGRINVTSRIFAGPSGPNAASFLPEPVGLVCATAAFLRAHFAAALPGVAKMGGGGEVVAEIRPRFAAIDSSMQAMMPNIVRARILRQ